MFKITIGLLVCIRSSLTYPLDGLGLWCWTPLSTIFQLFWWRKPEYLSQVTDILKMEKVTNKLYRIMLYWIYFAINPGKFQLIVIKGCYYCLKCLKSALFFSETTNISIAQILLAGVFSCFFKVGTVKFISTCKECYKHFG